MNVYRSLYYATLVGLAGGLLAALLGLLLSVPLADSGWRWAADTEQLALFGSWVAVLLYLHFDRLLIRKFRWSAIGFGLLFGLLSGLLAAGLAQLLRTGIGESSPILYRFAVWTLCSSLIGGAIGLRWVQANRARALHAYAGGLVGGVIGGAFFVLFAPHTSAGSSMAATMLAGGGIGFGTGIAPILVRAGLLRFISSGDPRAQNKLGNKNTLWDLEIDESYVLGSAPTEKGGTRFQQGADVFIPDAAMSPRHAVVFSRDGRYFIARHPDAGGPEGVAKFVLRIKGKTVVSSQELHPADDLLIGRTALRFESRKEGQ